MRVSNAPQLTRWTGCVARAEPYAAAAAHCGLAVLQPNALRCIKLLQLVNTQRPSLPTTCLLTPPLLLAAAAGGPQPEITNLAWNRKVQHILGTCTAAGTVVVWDLKKQRPVISFKDPSGYVRQSAGYYCWR